MKVFYTVWVGGIEVNDYYFDKKEDAEKLAQEYVDEQYDDVKIEKVTTKDEI